MYDATPPHLSPTRRGSCRVPALVPCRIVDLLDHHIIDMTSSSPKLLPPSSGPRLIVYHQTIHDPDGNYHSLLPLLTNNTGITHVIVAAIHLNDEPGHITLNDHVPDDERYEQLWGEVSWLQGSGVKVLGMLGGACKGSFEKLSGDEQSVRLHAHSNYPSHPQSITIY
jgi:hypothetical protein